MTRKLVAALAAAFVLVLLAANFAHAQSPLGIGAAEPSVMPTGMGWQFLAFVNEKQQEFYRLLTGALKAMREDPAKLALLVGLSFAYGIFHAAGPGHGKAVISSYMIANEVALRRGVLLSFMSSFAQGITAITVVGAAYLLLRGTTISMTDATHYMELASYLLIAFFGAWLLWRKLGARFFPKLVPAHSHGHAHSHDHHDHGHDHVHHDHSHGHARHDHERDHHHHGNHDHGHDHHHHAGEVCATCGHSHAPDPAMISGKDFSVREAWSAVMAVGLRPCSGSLLVLSFSLLNGLLLGGVLSVFAISLGTAITVSALAVMAVLAKDVALKFAGDRRADTVGFVIEIAGASLVLFLGAVMFLAAL
ncbi:MAG: delayed-early response protein/equilibrative nucleoside transporter [Rhizobiales bacterium]|nr:delayed-early response protein/equilibrative nucleoside transporter [Hyphomicrobiales bacterium]MBA68571.1 delayed-early response protein/equilibrative nucleoside transporter [Hyphomicrobiales bacterium]|tara:strand:- start:1970 stop:3058 length:1089 start_codon:yes stop_codon:yes gene_type:complete